MTIIILGSRILSWSGETTRDCLIDIFGHFLNILVTK